MRIVDIAAMLTFLQEMRKLQQAIDELNTKVYNPVGLNILWPRKAAFMFVSA